MGVISEPLNGGLVTARHPTLLRPGEVQASDEMILKPGDPAIQRAPGRSAYGTVRSTAVTCTTTISTTGLTSSSAFGTDLTPVGITSGSAKVTSSALFGAVQVGQTVVGTGIPAGTVVKRVVSANEIELSQAATATNASATITVSDFHPGTFITGTGITTGTYIASITDASNLTLSQIATASGAASRTFSEAVTGLEAISFNSVDDFALLAKAADKLYSSPLSALTGSFSALLSGLSQDADAILHTIRWANKHAVVTGFDRPRLVFYKDGVLTARTLGMEPVADFVGVSTTSGSWPSLSTFKEGWYYFLVTEVYNPGGDDEVESTYTGDPKGVHITDYATQGVKVTRSAAVDGSTDRANDGLYGKNAATHWRVYMSPKNPDEFPVPDLSTFRAIGDPIPIDIPSFTFSNANPYQVCYAAALVDWSPYAALFPGGSANALSTQAGSTVTTAFVVGSNQATSSAAFGSIKAGMTITSPNNRVPAGTTVISVIDTSTILMSAAALSNGSDSAVYGNSVSFDNLYSIVLPNGGTYRAGGFQNFAFANVGEISSSTITGIKVRVLGSYLALGEEDRGFYISIAKGGVGGTASEERWLRFPRKGTGRQFYESGGEGDTWGLSLAVGDMVTGTSGFTVRLRKHAAAVDIYHFIDGVEITVYAGANTINLDGKPFRTIIVSDQLGNAFGVGANGAPPIATCGALINGMMILGDGTDLVGSLPDEIEGYPDLYRVPTGDQVKSIVAYGRGGVIGCENSIRRLNYFPRETDADFSRGRAIEEVSVDHGCVGPHAMVLIDLPGRGSAVLYYSHNGLHITDAVTTETINEDIDWTGAVTGSPLIEPTLVHWTVLRTYPKYNLVAMYYVPYGGTRRTKVMYFSYHPTHLKNGRMPAVGPVSCQSGAADAMLLNGLPRLFTGHGIDGKVYVEDSGTTDENSAVPAMRLRTRRFYASQPGAEGRISRMYLVTDAAGNATTGAFTYNIYQQAQGEALTLNQSPTANTVVGGLIELWADENVETIEIEFAKTTSQTAAFRAHYLYFNDDRAYAEAKSDA